MSKRVVRPRRTDANQAEIMAALRKIGASVQPIHTVGRGCPDLLVGYRGLNFVLEIKGGKNPPSKRKLTTDEQLWHSGWRGQVAVVNTVGEAIRHITTIRYVSIIGDSLA